MAETLHISRCISSSRNIKDYYGKQSCDLKRPSTKESARENPRNRHKGAKLQLQIKETIFELDPWVVVPTEEDEDPFGSY